MGALVTAALAMNGVATVRRPSANTTTRKLPSFEPWNFIKSRSCPGFLLYRRLCDSKTKCQRADISATHSGGAFYNAFPLCMRGKWDVFEKRIGINKKARQFRRAFFDPGIENKLKHVPCISRYGYQF